MSVTILIFIALCNIHTSFAFLYLEPVITSLRAYLYYFIKEEVDCDLTIQGSYTRREFKHTGLISQ
jgi:hypothetical protein